MMNESTIEILSTLLEQKFNEIIDSDQWWRHEEIEDILIACDDLGLNELRTKLEDKL